MPTVQDFFTRLLKTREISAAQELLKLLLKIRQTSAADNNGLTAGKSMRWHGRDKEEQAQSSEKSQHALPQFKKGSANVPSTAMAATGAFSLVGSHRELLADGAATTEGQPRDRRAGACSVGRCQPRVLGLYFGLETGRALQKAFQKGR
jgi:hypothetical protein